MVAYVIARCKLYVGRQADSPALIASGYHSRVDIYASIVVVAGLGGAALGLENLDTAAAAIVVVMIFLSGFEIAAAAITALRHREQLQVESEDAHGHLPSRGWFRIYVPIASLALIALYFLTGIYTIQPGEVAVVRRFGKVIEEAGPGMHYRWPSPIETVDVVALDLVRRIETGPLQMLTGDENLISVRASIQFSVGDASAFVLSVSAPDDLVLQAAAQLVEPGMAIALDGATINVMTPEGLSVFFGMEARCHSRGLRARGIVYRVTDLAATEAFLSGAGIGFDRKGSRLVVPPADGQGAFYAFEEGKRP